MIREAIRQELIKLKNLTTKEKLKSFVFLNVSEEKEMEIREIVSEEFKAVEDSLKNQRKDEIRELLKQADWVNDKYFELLDRYDNTPVKREIFEWADDAYKHEYERLLSTPTSLNNITSELNLQIVNIV
jgi:glutamyl-tRNA reductase